MPSRDRDEAREVVERLFHAMEVGPEGEKEMMALFANDATFVESFTGEPRTHHGKDAIQRTYRELFTEPPPPDMKLVLHRVEREKEVVRAEWSCTSASYARPRVGFDLIEVAGGRIQKMEVVITQWETRPRGDEE